MLVRQRSKRIKRTAVEKNVARLLFKRQRASQLPGGEKARTGTDRTTTKTAEKPTSPEKASTPTSQEKTPTAENQTPASSGKKSGKQVAGNETEKKDPKSQEEAADTL